MILDQLNILLADDDIDDCHFFKAALDELLLSTHYTAVHDGEKLMKLLTNETEKLPNILFLDLNMPRKNGFECLEEIKKSNELKNLPVVIFSTSLDQSVVSRLYQSGAQFFIRKPSDIRQFQKIILHAITFLAQENRSQPARENFVVTF